MYELAQLGQSINLHGHLRHLLGVWQCITDHPPFSAVARTRLTLWVTMDSTGHLEVWACTSCTEH